MLYSYPSDYVCSGRDEQAQIINLMSEHDNDLEGSDRELM